LKFICSVTFIPKSSPGNMGWPIIYLRTIGDFKILSCNLFNYALTSARFWNLCWLSWWSNLIRIKHISFDIIKSLKKNGVSYTLKSDVITCKSFYDMYFEIKGVGALPRRSLNIIAPREYKSHKFEIFSFFYDCFIN
jgi:hypothetical protein